MRALPPASPSPDRRGRLVAGGCALLMAACLLAASAPAVAAVWRVRGQPSRVAGAVRASFPDFCGDRRDTIMVVPNPIVGPAVWDVSCVGGQTAGRVKVMSVNVLTCEARPPLEAHWEWARLRRAWLGRGQRLAICP